MVVFTKQSVYMVESVLKPEGYFIRACEITTNYAYKVDIFCAYI